MLPAVCFSVGICFLTWVYDTISDRFCAMVSFFYFPVIFKYIYWFLSSSDAKINAE